MDASEILNYMEDVAYIDSGDFVNLDDFITAIECVNAYLVDYTFYKVENFEGSERAYWKLQKRNN